MKDFIFLKLFAELKKVNMFCELIFNLCSRNLFLNFYCILKLYFFFYHYFFNKIFKLSTIYLRLI